MLDASQYSLCQNVKGAPDEETKKKYYTMMMDDLIRAQGIIRAIAALSLIPSSIVLQNALKKLLLSTLTTGDQKSIESAKQKVLPAKPSADMSSENSSEIEVTTVDQKVTEIELLYPDLKKAAPSPIKIANSLFLELESDHYRYDSKLIDKLRKGKQVTLNLSMINDLTHKLFTHAINLGSNIDYTGTSIFRPHEHSKYFPNVLSNHEVFLTISKRTTNRFIITSESALSESFEIDKNRFIDYVKWHERNHVGLWRIDPKSSNDLMQSINRNHRSEVLKTESFAFWRELYAYQCDYHIATLMDSPEEMERTFQLALPGMPVYEAIKSFSDQLIKVVKNPPSNEFDNIIDWSAKRLDR